MRVLLSFYLLDMRVLSRKRTRRLSTVSTMMSSCSWLTNSNWSYRCKKLAHFFPHQNCVLSSFSSAIQHTSDLLHPILKQNLPMFYNFIFATEQNFERAPISGGNLWPGIGLYTSSYLHIVSEATILSLEHLILGKTTAQILTTSSHSSAPVLSTIRH